MTSIINKYNIQKKKKEKNTGVNVFPGPYQKVRKSCNQVIYNRVQIKDHKVQIGLGSTTAPGLFPISH